MKKIKRLLKKLKRKYNKILYYFYKFTDMYKILFVEVKDKKKQIKCTKKNLAFVEIETFSFCNRQCWFCPNSFIDRHTHNNFMSEGMYLKIINDLAKINYSGYIAYSRYNEPLSDKIILERIRQAKDKLPNAFLFTHTNGDYLTRKYLDELSSSGLKLLKIQCYLTENEKFDVENVILPKINKMAKKLNLEYEILFNKQDFFRIKYKYDKMIVFQEAIDFNKNGVNRGDFVKKIKGIDRKEPCFSPFFRMYIDFDASVMPCCNVRHDIPTHKHLIMGNITHNNIFEIFTGTKFSDFRKYVEKYGEKIKPCNSCKDCMCQKITFNEKNINLF
ncbi:MAG TPA: SPASM domain-containing protein [Rickettsiales bacterium]|nr:SPASM domain-containing protein [Rickettsiales bacterium]